MKKMLEEVKYCKKMKKEHFNKDMIMTRTDKRNFKKAKKCHICNKKYIETDIRVRDHCHMQLENIEDQHTNFATETLDLQIRYQSFFTISEVMIVILSCKRWESLSRISMWFLITWINI